MGLKIDTWLNLFLEKTYTKIFRVDFQIPFHERRHEYVVRYNFWPNLFLLKRPDNRTDHIILFHQASNLKTASQTDASLLYQKERAKFEDWSSTVSHPFWANKACLIPGNIHTPPSSVHATISTNRILLLFVLQGIAPKTHKVNVPKRPRPIPMRKNHISFVV